MSDQTSTGTLVVAAVLGGAYAQRRRVLGSVLQALPVAVADSCICRALAQEGGRSRVDGAVGDDVAAAGRVPGLVAHRDAVVGRRDSRDRDSRRGDQRGDHDAHAR